MHPHGCVCPTCAWGDPLDAYDRPAYGKLDLSTVNPDVASDLITGITQITVAGITAAGAASGQRQPAQRGFRRAPAPPPPAPVAAPPPPPPPPPPSTGIDTSTLAYGAVALAILLTSVGAVAVVARRTT